MGWKWGVESVEGGRLELIISLGCVTEQVHDRRRISTAAAAVQHVVSARLRGAAPESRLQAVRRPIIKVRGCCHQTFHLHALISCGQMTHRRSRGLLGAASPAPAAL